MPRVLFLNASTVATAFILLNSTGNRFPNGLGNGSDQVGRNLMDHHKTHSLSASVPGYEGESILFWPETQWYLHSAIPGT